jgi:transposase-like protein
MPRRRTVTDSPEGDALDQAAREHGKAEQTYEAKRQALRDRIHAAHRAGMTISEIARRAGYTREHVSSIINDSNKEKTG